MRVMVTGGTGFVGAHTVAALVDAGHEVRLLVRSPDRVQTNLAPLGVPGDALKDVVTGDVTDSAAVESALTGCDAVVHAASVYSLDPRRAREIEQTNVGGTRLVLETAHRLGRDPIVHVSSYVALLDRGRRRLTTDTPPSGRLGAYMHSKAGSERVARELQARGAPVVSVLPGFVLGPDDPYLGDSARIIVNFMKGRLRMVARGLRLPVVDARDVARVIVATFDRRQGTYMATGHTVPFTTIADTIATSTGRTVRTLTVPPGFVGASVPLMDSIQRFSPWRLPMSGEMLREAVAQIDLEIDDQATRAELGVQPRPLEETLRDTIVSLVERGHLGKEAGALAGAARTG
jgi:dihydroflavonol-4-reductase